MKPLVLGYADGYTFAQLALWVRSLRLSGYEGHRLMLCRNTAPDTVRALAAEGFQVRQLEDAPDPRPVVARFAAMAAVLTPQLQGVSHVIVTDTRDLIFQTDPADWLRQNTRGHDLVVSDEGIRYGDGTWNDDNLRDSFGAAALDALRGRPVCNAGVIAGRPALLRDLFSDISAQCRTSRDPAPDQAALNLLLPRYQADTHVTGPDGGWAFQAAAGKVLRDGGTPVAGAAPRFADGLVRTDDGEPYAIVHQYDRVAAWAPAINRRYWLPTPV